MVVVLLRRLVFTYHVGTYMPHLVVSVFLSTFLHSHKLVATCIVLLGCLGCVKKYFGHKLVVPVLMHLSYIHIPNCMLYRHCSISHQVDVQGHSIENLCSNTVLLGSLSVGIPVRSVVKIMLW